MDGRVEVSWFEGLRRRKAKRGARLTAEQALERLVPTLRELLARLEGQSRSDLQVTLQLLPLGSRLALDAVGAVELEGENPVEGHYRLRVLPFCIDVVNAAALSAEKAFKEGRGDRRTDDDLAAALHGAGSADTTSDEPATSLADEADRDALPKDAGPSRGELSATAGRGSRSKTGTPRFAEPLQPVAILASSKVDEDKLPQALGRLVAEDPRCRLEADPEGRQHVLWCVEETDANRLLDRLSSEFGIRAATTELRVPLSETVRGRAEGFGRNVKQTGGHGEFAICYIIVEPLPPGGGFEFVDKIVGGVIPRQFVPSVERGVREQMEHGVIARYPMVDVRVTLIDGKAHSVDSSDIAFQKAGRAALLNAAAKAGVVLLEPVDEISVLVAKDHVGKVRTDLSSRRGRMLDTEVVAGGWTLVKAEIPELEITKFAADLRSISDGIGSLSRSYLRRQQLTTSLTNEILTVSGNS